MHAWEAAQQAVDYIEEHLQEELSNERLADLVSLSPFYFQRLFKRLVNKPVQEYIKLRRLARVTEDLDADSGRILDTALDYGFSSHANFTRAFKEAYGITPEEYKKTHPFLNTFRKPEISMNYIMADEGVPLIAGNIVLEINRKTLKAPEAYLGLSGRICIAAQVPVGEKTGTFTYFAGGLCKTNGQIPANGFQTLELPAGDYIVCRIEAASFQELVTDALDTAYKYLFGTWMLNHGLSSEPFSAEKYFSEDTEGTSIEIWIKPV